MSEPKTIRDTAELYLSVTLNEDQINDFTHSFSRDWMWYLILEEDQIDNINLSIWKEDCALWIEEKLDAMGVKPLLNYDSDELYESYNMDIFTDDVSNLVKDSLNEWKTKIIG